ncbi:hypothetical protein NA56DRAFT_582170 [Hyaloscypha hepaticicola]|uniref:Uncharacterized protein n=1 Tax=Hyaloscypha hepaticicola TaxID=2082293 RepID=A0A2J6PMU4_9HELO|nr:hypothetical protein NA56DRAFT_582170 [Hyaloscypha hepaticicola]
MFNFGWAKMDKYYKLTDKIPVYLIMMVLYPSRKWKWIEKYWKEDWIPEAKERENVEILGDKLQAINNTNYAINRLDNVQSCYETSKRLP